MGIVKNGPIQDLVAEHGGITLMLKVMGQMAVRIRKGEKIDSLHLKRMLEFLKSFADKCHHGKEEGYLFPVVTEDRTKYGEIQQFLGEHQSGRDLIRGIGEAINTYNPGNAEAFHLVTNIENYIQLLTGHIARENVLFSELEKSLPDKTQKKMTEEFEKLEREVIGEGKHEEYHRWLEEFEKIYL